MSYAELPKLFRDALAAEAEWKAVDRTTHPRIEQRLWDALRQARTALRQESPHLDSWLFYSAALREERRDELLRLIAEAQKEAGDAYAR